MKRPTTAVLIARAFTGLVTVWCLGCSGYEPLLNALLGTGAVMTCASEMSDGAELPDGTSLVAAATETAPVANPPPARRWLRRRNRRPAGSTVDADRVMRHRHDRQN